MIYPTLYYILYYIYHTLKWGLSYTFVNFVNGFRFTNTKKRRAIQALPLFLLLVLSCKLRLFEP